MTDSYDVIVIGAGPAGENAAAYAIAGAFKEYEREMNAAERVHPAFRGLNHPVNVNLGTVEGGEWNSSVPTRARIGMRVGVMLGRTAKETAADIKRLVAEAAERWPDRPDMGWPSWAFENHDAPRAVSRWVEPEHREQFARTKMLLLAALPALAYGGSLVWVFFDARRRGRPGVLVALLVAVVLWPLGLIVWLFVRPPRQP